MHVCNTRGGEVIGLGVRASRLFHTKVVLCVEFKLLSRENFLIEACRYYKSFIIITSKIIILHFKLGSSLNYFLQVLAQLTMRYGGRLRVIARISFHFKFVPILYALLEWKF